MTQQPFYPPQYPQAPQQVQQPYPPQQGFPQQPPAPQYPQQAYPAPPQQPTQPLAQGSLDDYFNQPSVGGGPSLSWTNKDGTQKPIGASFVGIVARDVTQADVQQETDQRTHQPKFFRDGRPKFVMKVPLKLQPSPDFPDGEATWWVKGQARDELVRAMAEVGCSGAPQSGAAVRVTLVQRKPMGAGMNPANVVQVQYQPPQGGQQAQQAPQASVAPSPVTETAFPAPQYQQPAQPQGQVLNLEQAVQQQAPAAPQVQAPQQPQGQAFPAAPQPPSDLSPEQQALLAQLTGGNAGQ